MVAMARQRQPSKTRIGQVLGDQRRRKHLKIDDVLGYLNQALGTTYGQSWWSKIESGNIQAPGEDVLRIAAELFELDTDELIGLLDQPQGPVAPTDRTVYTLRAEYLLREPVRVRVYGSVSASGDEWESVEYISEDEAEGSKDVRGFYVRGNCMEPDLSPGDVVIVGCDLLPVNGRMFAVRQDGHLFVKWYVLDEEGQGRLIANDGSELRPADVITVGRVLKKSNKTRRLSLDEIQGMFR